MEDLEKIEPVNLLEDGFNESIQVQSIQEEQNADNSRDDAETEEASAESSDEKVEEVEASEQTEESDEGSQEAEAETGTEEIEAFSLEQDKLYDLGDGVTITGKEAVNRLKSENQIRQKFGEIANKEQKLKQREGKLNQDLQVVAKHLQNLNSSENKLDAVKSLIAATGADPNQWFQQLVEEISPTIEELNSMDDSERSLLNKDSEIQRLQSEIESIKSQQTSAQYAQQLKTQIQTTLQENDLSEVDFQEAYQQVSDAVQQGQLPQLKGADEKTALAAVVDFAVNTKTLSRIDNVLDKIDPTLKNDDKVVRQLYSVVRNPYRSYDVTDEDLEDIVKASFDEDAAKAQKPAAKTVKKPNKEVKVLQEGNKSQENLFSLDDIEPMDPEELQMI